MLLSCCSVSRSKNRSALSLSTKRAGTSSNVGATAERRVGGLEVVWHLTRNRQTTCGKEIFLDHCLEEILLDEQTENQVRAQRLFHHVWRTHLAKRLTLHTYIRGTHICIYQSKPFGWVGHICLHLTMEFFIANLCPTCFPLHCLSAGFPTVRLFQRSGSTPLNLNTTSKFRWIQYF